MDDVTLGKMLTEAHRGQVDYCEPEGMSVRQSSSVRFDGSGKPDERDSSSAQIGTLLEEQRHNYRGISRKKSVITNSKQLTQKKSADSYKDNYCGE